MSVKPCLPWICAACLAIAGALIYRSNQQQASELAKLRTENAGLNRLPAVHPSQIETEISSAESPELEKLRADNKDLLRLRDKVRQLRAEKADLHKRLLTAQSQIRSLVGTNVAVRYDSTVWKPLSAVNGSAYQSMTLEIQHPDWVQITVQNNPERTTDSDYKHRRLEAQKFRGDPAELIAERRETWGDRDWFVLEFRNSNIQPPRREISYFLPTDKGHTTLFIVGEETSIATHRETINSFLRQIEVTASASSSQ